jgi:chromosome segregation ATPase
MFAAAVLGSWSIVRATINAMGEAIRTEYKAADKALLDKLESTSTNCTRHDEDITLHATRIFTLEANQRGFDQTYGEMSKQLEQIEKKIDEHIAKKQEQRIELEHRLTLLEGRPQQRKPQGDET